MTPPIFHVIDTSTGAEPDTMQLALKEEWAKNLVYCDIEGWALGEDGTLYLIDECGNVAYAPEDLFRIVWAIAQ